MTVKMLRALVFCSFSSAVCSFAAVDIGLLGLVPPDAQFVIGINAVGSRNSDFGRYPNTRLNADSKGFEQLDTLTGFDPMRDLESVVFAGVTSPSGNQSVRGVLFARGTFDQSKITSAALAKGAVVQNFSGVDFYLRGDGNGRKGFAFFDSDVFATGSLAQLQKAAANRASATALDPKLQQLITQAGAENDIWFASTVPASQFATHLQTELGQSAAGGSQIVQAISSASGGVKFGNGNNVQVMLDAVAQSEKDASALADVLRFGASLLQVRSQSDPKAALLASALNQMLLSAKGQNVHLSLSIPEATVEQLADSHSPRRLAHQPGTPH